MRAAISLWAVLALAFLLRYYDRILRLIGGDASVWSDLLMDAGPGRWVVVLLAAGILGAFLRVQRTTWVLPAAAVAATAALSLVPPGLIPGFPRLGEASLRTFGALTGAAMMLVPATAAGMWLLRRFGWTPDDPAERLLFSFTLGIGITAAASLLLMATGLYGALTLRVLFGVGTLAALIPLLRTAASWVRGRQHRELPPVSLPDHLWRGVCAMALTAAFAGALAPEVEYDALWYHLWLPKLWLEQGGLVDLVHEYITLYPSVWDLAFAGGLATGGPVAAKLLHFVCFPLVLLLVHRLVRTLFPDVSPWPAVGLTATIPLVLWEATTAYVDLALALHAGVVLLALIRWAKEGTTAWLNLAGILLGVALGVKHLALFVALLAGCAVVIIGFRRGEGAGAALRPAVRLAVLSLLPALFWYVRSWLASGNPFFPDLYAVFGAAPPERWNDATEAGLGLFKEQFGRARTPANLLTLPVDLVLHGARYGGALGPLVLLGLPLALLLKNRWEAAGLTAALAGYVMLWASPVSSFQARFLLPVIPLWAALAGAGLGALATRSGGRGVGRAAAVAVPLLAVLHLPPFLSLHETDRDGWAGWLTHVFRRVPAGVVTGRTPEAAYLQAQVPSVRVWEYADRHLPQHARILTFPGGDHYYATRPRIMAHATMAHRATYGAQGGHEAAALEALHGLGITHVLYDRRDGTLDGAPDLAIAGPAFFAAALDTVYADGRYLLAALRSGGVAGRGLETP
jgi:4-amino-4-deoxy-L-arabinose transferase-like glycosyltransferase